MLFFDPSLGRPRPPGHPDQGGRERAEAVRSPERPQASNPSFFCRGGKFCRIRQNGRKLRMAQYRRQERHRSSRLQHSASFRATKPNKASLTLMLAAASIKVMDALFGLAARNDAESYKRELLGRSWRRDWGMLNFQHFYVQIENRVVGFR